MYEQTDQYNFQDETQQTPASNVISTSQAINLTCTLASLSTLFALFLCFADQRSRAVRRYAVQSVGLGVLHIAAGMACWILSAVLGWIPLAGYYLYILLVAAFIVVSVFVLTLRIRLMFNAYRGLAYVLPSVGQALRRFE